MKQTTRINKTTKIMTEVKETRLLPIADIRIPGGMIPCPKEVEEIISRYEAIGEFPTINVTFDNQLIEGISAINAASILGQDSIVAESVTDRRGSGRKEVIEISVKLLRKHPLNTEIYGAGENVQDLVDALQASHEIDPLCVHKEADNTYTILRGHRRFDASQLIGFGMETLPCIVLEGLDENQKLRILLTGNVQREKTIEQKVKEAWLWEQIYKDEAKQVSRKKGQGLGPVRDRVAKQVGLGSGVNYERAKEVVAAAEEGHPQAEKIKQIISSPTGKVLTAYNLIKPKETKQPKSVEQESQQKQKTLGLGKWNGESVLPDMGRNEGFDPNEVSPVANQPIPIRPIPTPQPPQIPLQLLEELKAKALGDMELGKNNRRIANQAIENFINELCKSSLVESREEAA